jgi:hypothetical protein
MDDEGEPVEAELLRLGDARVVDPLAAEIVTSAVGEASPEELLDVIGERAVFC